MDMGVANGTMNEVAAAGRPAGRSVRLLLSLDLECTRNHNADGVFLITTTAIAEMPSFPRHATRRSAKAAGRERPSRPHPLSYNFLPPVLPLGGLPQVEPYLTIVRGFFEAVWRPAEDGKPI